MSVPAVRRLAVAFFALNVVAVVWPGFGPFNRVEPFVLGLPFNMVWLAGWLVAAMLVLILVERVEHPGGDD